MPTLEDVRGLRYDLNTQIEEAREYPVTLEQHRDAHLAIIRAVAKLELLNELFPEEQSITAIPLIRPEEPELLELRESFLLATRLQEERLNDLEARLDRIEEAELLKRTAAHHPGAEVKSFATCIDELVTVLLKLYHQVEVVEGETDLAAKGRAAEIMQTLNRQRSSLKNAIDRLLGGALDRQEIKL